MNKDILEYLLKIPVGIMVPESRKIVKKYFKSLSIKDIRILLQSQMHEERFVAAMMLVEKFNIAQYEEKKEIFSFYIGNSKKFNNWDLVDLSAPNIVGGFLSLKAPSPGSDEGLVQDRAILYEFVKSESLWERRISILATLAFIRQNDFEDILRLGEILLDDKHDLMHKAVGWMLREVGKRDEIALVRFLDKNIAKMPRTMLRYSIEKFSEDRRKHYLAM